LLWLPDFECCCEELLRLGELFDEDEEEEAEFLWLWLPALACCWEEPPRLDFWSVIIHSLVVDGSVAFAAWRRNSMLPPPQAAFYNAASDFHVGISLQAHCF
jgi:hypothetical protein